MIMYHFHNEKQSICGWASWSRHPELRASTALWLMGSCARHGWSSHSAPVSSHGRQTQGHHCDISHSQHAVGTGVLLGNLQYPTWLVCANTSAAPCTYPTVLGLVYQRIPDSLALRCPVNACHGVARMKGREGHRGQILASSPQPHDLHSSEGPWRFKSMYPLGAPNEWCQHFLKADRLPGHPSHVPHLDGGEELTEMSPGLSNHEMWVSRQP